MTLKIYKWRFYRFRRKHKGWYLTLLTGILGLVAGLMITLGLSFFYPKGMDSKTAIPMTAHQTLAEGKNSTAQKVEEKSESQSALKASPLPKEEPSAPAVTSTTQAPPQGKASVQETAPQPSAPPVTYTATVGAFTRSSTISQTDAQTKAQVAYDEQIVQEKANRQRAEEIKASIERESPGMIVNIIQESQ